MHNCVNRPDVNLVHNDMDPTNNLVIQRFSHLDITYQKKKKKQHLTDITIWISMGRFFDTTIDIDYEYPCIMVTYIDTDPRSVKTPTLFRMEQARTFVAPQLLGRHDEGGGQDWGLKLLKDLG